MKPDTGMKGNHLFVEICCLWAPGSTVVLYFCNIGPLLAGCVLIIFLRNVLCLYCMLALLNFGLYNMDLQYFILDFMEMTS